MTKCSSCEIATTHTVEHYLFQLPQNYQYPVKQTKIEFGNVTWDLHVSHKEMLAAALPKYRQYPL